MRWSRRPAVHDLDELLTVEEVAALFKVSETGPRDGSLRKAAETVGSELFTRRNGENGSSGWTRPSRNERSELRDA